MKFLKVKEIIAEEDKRESNLIRNSVEDIIGHKQSKCTIKFIFKDINGEEYCWVKENKDLGKAIGMIAENEDKKYDVKNKPWLLGRNMFFLSWLYEIYKKYLTKFGFNPPKEDLEKAKRFKHANKN